MNQPTLIRLLLVVLFYSPFSYSQTLQEKTERFIIQEVQDSIDFYLPKLPNSNYVKALRRIGKDEANTNDYIQFLEKASLFGKPQYQAISKFLFKRVKYPNEFNHVDLDFVRFKSFHIELIANEIDLKQANKESQVLRSYLNKIKKTNTKEYKLAKLYGELHPGLLEMIKRTKTCQKVAFQKASEAVKLGDLILALKFRELTLDYFIYLEDLDGYIETCEESLQMEMELPERSPMYRVTVSHLLDALIFKHQGSDPSIEKLLLDLYNSPDFKYRSYSLFAKYLGHVNKNDPAAKRVFDLFGVKNIKEFSEFVVNDAKGKINDNELYFIYSECSMAAYYHEDYGTSFSFGNDKSYLIKQIYSSELSQTIADYQTREVEREKEFKIQKEKEKGRIYLILAIVIAVFLIVSIYLVVIYIRKSRILAIRNQEKETLVKEINHRVKNNFQLVNALLEMQSKDIDDAEVIKKLHEGQSRIKSMSLIHQKLYQTEYLGLVDFQEYTEQLMELMLNMVDFKNVKCEVKAKSILLDIDTAIPLGLILNELITNSLKYALTDRTDDFIKVEIVFIESHTYQFSYRDSGTGFNVETPAKGTGMGMKLIRSLIRQLQGVTKNGGFNENGISFTFKDKAGRKQLD